MNLRWFSIAVGVLSFSTIALQLMLTRIFSVTMYYHFGFMVISIALLGIAVAGVAVYLLPRVFKAERAPALASLFTLLFSLGAIFALKVALKTPAKLGALSVNTDALIDVYFATAIPFLMSGFGITLAISNAGAAIGRIYAFDLIGAALGCLVVVPLVSWLGAPGAITLLAGFACFGAVAFAISSPMLRVPLAGLAAVAAAVLIFLGATEPSAQRYGVARNPNKFLGNRPVLFEKWNAFSQITVARGDTDHNWIFIDGDAATRMWHKSVAADNYARTRKIPEVCVASLAYSLRSDGVALIIGPGGGADVISALRAGVKKVIGVEINPIIIERVMRGQFTDYNGDLYRDPRVQIVVDEGRSFIRRADQKFATIQATLVDTWAASSSGAFTLSENNLYTEEALIEFLSHLDARGVLTMTRWYAADKPREMMRLLVLARTALGKLGVPPQDAHKHFVIATDGARRTTMLLGRSAFSPAELATLGEAVKRDRLRVLFTPDAMPGARILEDKQLATLLRAPDLDAQLQTYDFDLSSVTDDRPFFFYSLFPHQIFDLIRQSKAVELNDLGALILLTLLGLSAALTFAFVVLPLFAFRAATLRENAAVKLRVLAFFLCLGLAFIMVEIGLMQHFVLFLGHPIYSLAVVLASLLASSGVGSALSQRAQDKLGERRFLWTVAGALAVLLGLYAVGLTPLFHALLGLPIGARIALSAVLVWLPGMLMGTLLPSGVRVANSIAADLVPWGWGLNGATSVLGSILAMFVSMNLGFTAALGVGLVIYALTPVLLPKTR